MMTITENTVVSFRYMMTDKKGKVLEDRTSGTPACYLHGGTSISPLLQQQLAGMSVGEQRDIILDHTGVVVYFNVQVIELRAANAEELLLGYPLGTSEEICEADCKCFET